jgi:glycosyltransferase involved in cell wall biosynthesis
MTGALTQTLADFALARWVLGLALLARAGFYALLRKPYRAINDYCTVVRVSNSKVLTTFAREHVDALIESARRTGKNPLPSDYLADPASTALARSYALGGEGPHDLFRDLIVLKIATPEEKGVILLKYARTFSAAVALLDVPRLQERYRFVLEPCWAGYCDPALLMFFTPGHPVLVQCFTDEDRALIDEMGEPFVPLRLGPADWVDASVFEPQPIGERPYDLVMVANWGSHKRHAALFKALRSIKDRQIRVLLIGFPWAGRTADDIRAEAAALCGGNITVEVVEKLPQAELARYVARAKAFVFLTKKEGDNKALVEAMFADVPAIVYRDTVGGARRRINESTGILSTDDELPANIRHMLDHYADFSPRRWAIDHTGSSVATRVLDGALALVARKGGEAYEQSIVEKTNAPNLAYKNPRDRERFAADYEFIVQCLRRPRATFSVAVSQRSPSTRS